MNYSRKRIGTLKKTKNFCNLTFSGCPSFSLVMDFWVDDSINKNEASQMASDNESCSNFQDQGHLKSSIKYAPFSIATYHIPKIFRIFMKAMKA